MPRVSVIVAAYDAEAHLATALDSVVAQRFGDWEVVVADDGSRDGTAALAASYGDRVRVVRHETNRGLAAARNLALAHARGELVAILDSDDAWLPDYLERQVARVDAERAGGRDVAVVCCDAHLFDDEGPLGETFGERFGRPPTVIDAAALLRANTIFVGVLAARAAVERAGGFDERLRRVEDLDLWLRVLEGGHRIVYQPVALARYRVGPGGLSADPLAMARARQAVYRAALGRGLLSARAEVEARRALRLERAAEIVELARRARRRRPARAAAALALATPLLARVAAERTLAGRPPAVLSASRAAAWRAASRRRRPA